MRVPNRSVVPAALTVATTSVVVALLAALEAPPAFGQECGYSITASHQLDSAWTGMPEAEVAGRVLVLADPRIHNGTAEFLCRFQGQDSAQGPCPPGSGTGDDGVVHLNGNWGALGVTGCPAALADGDAPVAAYYASIHGEGTRWYVGVAILMSVGYSQDYGGYVFDLARPLDGGDKPFLDLPARVVPVPRLPPRDEGEPESGTETLT
jgi:hypothetical protein